MSEQQATTMRDHHLEEEKERREQALHVIKNYEQQIFKNELEIDNEKFKILSVTDLINKENKFECSYCILHGPHTPCGSQLKEYKDCINEKSKNSEEECKKIFESKFYPCFVNLSSKSPYLYYRANLLFGLNTTDLFKVWFNIQKTEALKK
ncbi:hypothetical protein ABK040_015072 [Willaertia magna]